MTTFRGVLGVACLAGVLPTQLVAQGPFIDWINKMSGPELRTYGATFRFPGYKPGRFLNFGYNPGQRITTDELMILRQGILLMQTLDIPTRQDSGINAHVVETRRCLLEANARFAPNGTIVAYAEAQVDSLRNDIREELAPLLLTADSAMLATRGQVLRSISCGIRDADLRTDPGWGLRLRAGLSYGHDRQNVDRPETSIYAVSPQLTAELLFGRGTQRRQYFGIETGAAAWFWIGDFKPFVSYSFPVIANYHPFARCSSWLLRNLRVGGGFHYFTDIDEEKFGAAVFPEVVGGEVVPTFFVSFDVSRSSLRSAPRLGCGP